MSSQASFTLKGRNPDVLTCIANLSNDEVFTPPELANRMLDAVAKEWAADHGGANIWENKDAKFLDPFTKSGVFLREITSRLTKGLEHEIPDLQKRVDHILTNQIFGIGITHRHPPPMDAYGIRRRYPHYATCQHKNTGASAFSCYKDMGIGLSE